jgi:hypothetical protein
MNAKIIASGAGVAANSMLLLSQLGASALLQYGGQHDGQPAVSNTTSESAVLATSEDSLSLEESFLRVPRSCKDRTFSFDPIPVPREVASERALNLHYASGEVDA